MNSSERHLLWQHASSTRSIGTWLVLVSCLLFAAMLGGITERSPITGIAVSLSFGAIAIFALRGLPMLFLTSLEFILTGYAFLSKGFAYFGFSPLYVGEMVLILALIALLARLPGLKVDVTTLLLLAFMAWGACRTVPYLHEYGTYAMRDSVIWLYGFFSIAISATVTTRGAIDKIASWYRRVAPLLGVWFVIAIPLNALGHIPQIAFPGAPYPIFFFKAGDAAVQLAIAAVFFLTGMQDGPVPSHRRLTPVIWICWFAAVGLVATQTRGGMAAVAIATLFTLLLYPTKRWLPFLSVGITILLVLAIVNPQIDIGRNRQVSFSQLTENVSSILGGSSPNETRTAAGLQGSKEWRLDWWKEIINYTVHGPYFWSGKGFGINLAISDHIQAPDATLRSPHSAHMTVLARMGVPGFLLWVALLLTFTGKLIHAIIRARHQNWHSWAMVDTWIIASWLAILINGSFDVYLEGPQGGIWFWSVFGLGLAALRVQADQAQSQPVLFSSEERYHAYPLHP